MIVPRGKGPKKSSPMPLCEMTTKPPKEAPKTDGKDNKLEQCSPAQSADVQMSQSSPMPLCEMTTKPPKEAPKTDGKDNKLEQCSPVQSADVHCLT